MSSNIIDKIDVQFDENSISVLLPELTENTSFNADDWAQQIFKKYPGSFHTLSIDLQHYRSINSILCAGFIHLYRSYEIKEAHFINVNSNVEGILKTLQLDRIFNISFS